MRRKYFGQGAVLLVLILLLIPMVVYLSGSVGILWEDHFDREGSLSDRANAVDARGNLFFTPGGNRAFVVGRSETFEGGAAFAVRVYDVAGDGAGGPKVLWEDHFDKQGDLSDEAKDVAVSGDRVFAVGVTGGVGGAAFSVRAYNATGDGAGGPSVLWEDHFDREGGLIDEANAVAVGANGIFVVGQTEDAASERAFAVRTYDAAGDGAGGSSVLWEDHFNLTSFADPDVAKAVAVSDNRVFVVGTTGHWTGIAANGPIFSVRAYNASSGIPLWEDHFDREEGLHGDGANAVAVSGNRVFAVGYTGGAGGLAFAVRAYDAAGDGAEGPSVLWEDHFNREGVLQDYANAVAVSDNRVFVVGFSETAAGGPAFTVRAYDVAGDGAGGPSVLWEDHFDREQNLRDEAKAVAVSGDRVFVVGVTETASGGLAFSVRAYDAAGDGAGGPSVLWENHFDRLGNRRDSANAVAVLPGFFVDRIFVAGTTEAAAGDSFTVRAYNYAGSRFFIFRLARDIFLGR